MKKFTVFIYSLAMLCFLTFLVFSSNLYAQVYEGELILSSQAEVDAFNYVEVISIIIQGDDIVSLEGLSSLENVRFNLEISNNPLLKNLQGLQNITSSIYYLEISNNDSLESLDGLPRLVIEDGGLFIHDNPVLTDISVLESLSIDDESPDLSIYNNLSLSMCCSVLDYMDLDHEIYVYNNAPGCNSKTEVINKCKEPSICNDDIIELRSQADVDNFNCSHLNGTLRIFGNNDITHLDSLYRLQTIGGDLSIYANDNIESLHGLENLTSVGGDLDLFNRTVESLHGLKNLTSVGGELTLLGNDKLTNLEGLNALYSVGSLTIWENDKLLNLKGLDQLQTVNGEINIWRNQSLKNLKGLPSLAPEHNGMVSILENNSLTELTGLENLKIVHGNLFISENPLLSNITGLENLETIDKDLYITHNPSLSNITGLENLETINKDLAITHNSSLSNLEGLKNLTHIGAVLFLYNNTSLSDCCAISNLEVTAAQSVIRDNAAGCNSRQEVTTCSAVVSFTLVNADTDTDIMELTNGMQLYLHALPNAKLSIRANTKPATVGSVFLSVRGPVNESQIENVAPYALFGDENGDYNGENLGVGSYTITATLYSQANLKGEKGPSLSLNFDIAEETLDCAGFSASITQITDVSTCGGSDGSATVEVSGNVGKVTYQWSQGATTATASNLAPGNYTVTVTDEQGCSETLNVFIGSPALPKVTLASFASVSESDAPFALSGGSPVGGTYSGAGVSNGMFDPSAVGSGSYEITYSYTDPTTQCSASATQMITVEPEFQGDAVVGFTLVNAKTDTDIMALTDGLQLNIHELPNAPLSIRANTNPSTVGSVYLSLNGPVNTARKEGVAPYALFGDKNGGGNYDGETFTIGSYIMSATPYSGSNLDGEEGQSLSIDFEIVDEVLDCAGFSASITQITDVSTCGGSDGSATAEVSGNVGEVTYQWSHGATTATASNLEAGKYTVTVTDTKGCSTTLPVTIGSPASPEVSLAPFSSVMEDDSAFALSGGSPAGGIYSGAGVSNGMFDPSAVEPGDYEITYNYTDPNTNCAGSATQWITVEPRILGIPVYVERFVLVNADTDTDIMELTDGMQLNIHDLPNAALNIRAETYPSTVSSVILSLSGPLSTTRKEGVAPYALFGDINGNYGGKNFGTGSYTLSATPYFLDDVEEETEGESLSLNFSIVDEQGLNLRKLNAEINELVSEVDEQIAKKNQDAFAVYPNPFSDEIQVEITDSTKVLVEVYLIDLNGKTIYHETVKPTSGKSEIYVDADNLPHGTYILKVKWGDRVEMEKLIK